MIEAVLKDDLVKVRIFFVESQEKHGVFDIKINAKRLVFALKEDLEEIKFVTLIDT